MLFQLSTLSRCSEVSARRICIYPVLALNCEESFVTLITANQTPAGEIDREPLSQRVRKRDMMLLS
jgi:hypothetical protein